MIYIAFGIVQVSSFFIAVNAILVVLHNFVLYAYVRVTSPPAANLVGFMKVSALISRGKTGRSNSSRVACVLMIITIIIERVRVRLVVRLVLVLLVPLLTLYQEV